MEFNPLRHPILFLDPRFISTATAWAQHFPFAFLAVDLCRPRVLVELGTHQGDSYFAFCQAVSQLQTETRCFAVDTWAGDPQAGYYGEQVLTAVRNHHDPLYSGFSTLMKTTFDAAAAQFQDGQVDLLHIDGLHTYEAVRHDFESWRAKMSDRCVVLFHDTWQHNRADFGVWRLWDELAAQFPAFEFKHGEGLGVLLVGANVPQPMKECIEFANANAQDVRSLFQALGGRIQGYQASLRTVQFMMTEYEIIRQWRQRTRQEQLIELSLQTAMQNPPELARFLASEVNRVLGQAGLASTARP